MAEVPRERQPDAPTIAESELADDVVIVDVREPEEFAAGHAPHAVNIPLGELPSRVSELPEGAGPVVLACGGGGRGGRGTAWLNIMGIPAVNLRGGMRGWNAAGRPMVADDGGEPRFD